MPEITILFDGQKLELKSGFIGGIMNDFTEAPVGMYSGKMDVGSVNLQLMTLLRAVIKLNVEDYNLSYDQAQKFIDLAVKEAMKHEKENKNIDNATLDMHETVIKMRRDN